MPSKPSSSGKAGLGDLVVQHLVDIMAGQCKITQETIEASIDDPEMCQILTGLLYLHEDLQLRDRQIADRTKELNRLVRELWAEMDLARKLQTVLLPDVREMDEYRIASTMKPATQVGGDYYDIVQSPTGTWVLIGDVSGHGVAAGLTMMTVQTAARALILSGYAGDASPARMLTMLNSTLRDNIRRLGNQYVTLTACHLVRGNVTHAGLHQDILVHRAGERRVEQIETRGTWIGIHDDLTDHIVDSRFQLGVGDTMLLYTDGLTEARRDGAWLHEQELARAFQDLAGRESSPDAILRGLEDTFSDCDSDDDVSIIVVQRSAAKPAA